MRASLSREEDARRLAALQEHATDKEAAEALGITYGALVGWKKSRGVSRPQRRTTWAKRSWKQVEFLTRTIETTAETLRDSVSGSFALAMIDRLIMDAQQIRAVVEPRTTEDNSTQRDDTL